MKAKNVYACDFSENEIKRYNLVLLNMYHYTLKNPSAAVKVVATDRFGKTFEQDYITTNKVEDYPDKF